MKIIHQDKILTDVIKIFKQHFPKVEININEHIYNFYYRDIPENWEKIWEFYVEIENKYNIYLTIRQVYNSSLLDLKNSINADINNNTNIHS